MFVLLRITDPCQELWKHANIHHKYRSKKNREPAQAAAADAKEAPIVKTTLCFSKMSWRRDKTKDWIPSPMSTHQVKNLKRMQLMSGEESCIRMAWSLMGRYKMNKRLQIPEKRIKRKLHENDMISDGYKRNKQLQIPEKNQKIIAQTFTEKKVSCTAFCAFRTLALTCCIASCLSPTPSLPTVFFSWTRTCNCNHFPEITYPQEEEFCTLLQSFHSEWNPNPTRKILQETHCTVGCLEILLPHPKISWVLLSYSLFIPRTSSSPRKSTIPYTQKCATIASDTALLELMKNPTSKLELLLLLFICSRSVKRDHNDEASNPRFSISF